MKMTVAQSEAMFKALKTGKARARDVVARLIADGENPFNAEEAVFHALGGGDIVREGKDGKDYYDHSGKTVEEVNRLMAE